MPYVQAHKVCEDAGRRPSRPMRPEAVNAVYIRYASAPWASFLDHPQAERPTVAQLARELRNGRYIFKVRHHVFAIVDGTCIDACEARLASASRRLLDHEGCIAAEAVVPGCPATAFRWRTVIGRAS